MIHYQSGPHEYPRFKEYKVTGPMPVNPKTILVIKLDALGDYLLYTPFYSGLRKLYPDAKITLICNPTTFELAEHNPVFNEIVQFQPAGSQSAFLFAMNLPKYDLVINPRWWPDYYGADVIVTLVDSPCKLAFSTQNPKCYTTFIEDIKPLHEVWRGMEMLNALGLKDFEPKQQIHLADDEELFQIIMPDKPIIGFGIGGSSDFKRWPRYADLAKKLEGTILVFGNGRDEELSKEIEAANPNVINLVNRLSIRQTAEAIRYCDLMICNDSLHMHCAATHGIPIVEIIGEPPGGNPGDQHLPAQFGPWGSKFVWVQPDEGGINNVTVDEVLEAMGKLNG